MDASRPSTDPLARYTEPHRLKVRAQARRLAEVLAAAIPPTERGGWSGDQWEDALYASILQECAPRVRVDPSGAQPAKE